MTTQHTPGPWVVFINGHASHAGLDILTETDGELAEKVAQTNGWNQANARLIAAAPDLLNACKANVAEITGGSLFPGNLCSGPPWPLEMLKAAIEKAEGGAA